MFPCLGGLTFLDFVSCYCGGDEVIGVGCFISQEEVIIGAQRYIADLMYEARI